MYDNTDSLGQYGYNMLYMKYINNSAVSFTDLSNINVCGCIAIDELGDFITFLSNLILREGLYINTSNSKNEKSYYKIVGITEVKKMIRNRIQILLKATNNQLISCTISDSKDKKNFNYSISIIENEHYLELYGNNVHFKLKYN